MSTYSLGAYRIAVHQRSAKTLLVEGVSDKTVMKRLLLDEDQGETRISDRPLVDTPEIVSDRSLSGLGRKAQVELIVAHLNELSSKFKGLVDREWDGLDTETFALEADQDDDAAMDRVPVRTRGHSIENYFLDASTFRSLLARQWAVHLNPGMLRLFDDAFHNMCKFALAYSLAARDCEVIGRFSGFVSRTLIIADDSSFRFDREAFIARAATRSIAREKAVEFLDIFDQYQAHIERANVVLSHLKWASHGHLSHEAIWSCIAALLARAGCLADACERMERGITEEKLRHGADALAVGDVERRPLDALVRWLVGRNEAVGVTA